jgi:hypothetical protein
VPLSDLNQIFKPIQIAMAQNISSGAQKIPTKIWIYRELNNEQLSLLELFKIRDRFKLKNHGSSRVEFDQNLMEFDWNFKN